DGHPTSGVTGAGDVLVIDVGGATTDVYSVLRSPQRVSSHREMDRGDDESSGEVAGTLWRARAGGAGLRIRPGAPRGGGGGGAGPRAGAGGGGPRGGPPPRAPPRPRLPPRHTRRRRASGPAGAHRGPAPARPAGHAVGRAEAAARGADRGGQRGSAAP